MLLPYKERLSASTHEESRKPDIVFCTSSKSSRPPHPEMWSQMVASSPAPGALRSSQDAWKLKSPVASASTVGRAETFAPPDAGCWEPAQSAPALRMLWIFLGKDGVSLPHGISLLRRRAEVVTRCGGAHFNPSTWEVDGGGAGGAGRPVLLLVSLRPTSVPWDSPSSSPSFSPSPSTSTSPFPSLSLFPRVLFSMIGLCYRSKGSSRVRKTEDYGEHAIAVSQQHGTTLPKATRRVTHRWPFWDSFIAHLGCGHLTRELPESHRDLFAGTDDKQHTVTDRALAKGLGESKVGDTQVNTHN